MVKYMLDPTENCTMREIEAILARNRHGLWWLWQIPKGCKRHFVPVKKGRVVAASGGRSDDDRG